jgi:fatty-acyl-CoA synthase
MAVQSATEKVYRTELSPVSFLRRSAYVYPDRTAVVHGERRYTYREFDERVNRLSTALRSAGLEKGDRVAFICTNTPQLLEAHYGVPAAGGILVAINYRLNRDHIGYILDHSGARFVFVDREFEPIMDAAQLSDLEAVWVDDTGAPDDAYEKFLAEGSAEPPPSVLKDEEETISINYTSGTTGRPKGVLYTYRGAYLNALGEALETRLGPDSVYLWTLPMFHCKGWCFTWGVTAVGGCHVCLRKVDPELVWELFASEGVTHYNGAPTVQTSLVDHPEAHRLDRQVITTVAGAPPSAELLGRLEEVNIHPVHVYGATETYGPITVCERQAGWNELALEDRARC